MESIDFRFSNLWVQVHRLLLKFLNTTNVKKVGAMIRHVNMVQNDVSRSFVRMT